jgi:phosphatidate phosphatase APP1
VDEVLPVAMTVGMHPVVLCPAGGRAAEGRVMVWGDVTRGLVSDIDDTVMVTWLPRPFLAAWNTFVLRETARREVGGMAVLYREFVAAHPGAAMVYLSTGAWNAAPVLRRFLHRHGFPDGPLLLTDWGPSNTGWFRSGRDHKREQLDRLARELPGVRWLLVGDDGQHDPELYEAFAGRFPDSVDAIALRQLTIAEQVLSRGAPVPPTEADDGGVPSTVIRVNGHDGHALLEQLRRRGVL